MTEREECICALPLIRKSFAQHFDALHCSGCRSVHFVAAKDALPPPDFDYNSGTDKYAQDEYLYGKQLRWSHIEILKQDWRGKKVLEIGCFNGFFLDELKKIGADVYGFDVNKDALAVGGQLFELGDRLDDSMANLARNGPFDAILCVDVLEHLNNPESVLEEIHALLKPGGRVIVAGPTIERRFRDKSDYPPHHKWWFSRNGLATCLGRFDFEVTSIAVQRDGMLFIRNFIGKALHGLHRKEFYGETKVEAPKMNSRLANAMYSVASTVGIGLFTLFRISYCSTIITASKAARR